MRWAVVSHPEQMVKGRLLHAPRLIAEDSISIAQGQGWIVLATDSACLPDIADVNAQSNPRRIIQPGEDV